MAEAAPPSVGTVVDQRYRILAQLGRGGMGEVFRAEQISLKREVALKLMRAELGESAEAAARFEREALALSRLDHPNVVRVIDFGRAGGQLYLAMELVGGHDLSSELFRGPMSPERAVRVLGALCDALAAAHARGIVHRDLKPENVILAEGDVPKVLDFGLAIPAEVGARVTQSGFVLGTPEYMSPEQAMGLTLDGRSDLYSLGVMAYRMLSGKLPFTTREPREYLALHAGTPAPDLAQAWSQGTSWPELCAAVMRALEKDPGRRYAGAAEMKAALEGGLLHAPPPALRAASETSRAMLATSAMAVRTQNLSLLFAEMMGWTDAVARLPPEAASALQARLEDLLVPVAKRLGGRKVKAMGGTVLFTVPSPTAAVEIGMALQDCVWEDQRDQPHLEPIGLRVAMSAGEVTVDSHDVFGEPVNIAARVLELAGDGEVLFTDAVYLAMNRAELLADELGAQSLRGIPYPVRAFRVKRSTVAELPPYGRSKGRAHTVMAALAAVGSAPRTGRWRWALVGLGAAAALALIASTVRYVRAAPYRAAEMTLAHGHPDQALAALGPLLAQEPPPARALDLAGRANLGRGEYERAFDQLRQANTADRAYRADLVDACLKAMAEPSGRQGCQLRREAIALLVSVDGVEAGKPLTQLAAQRRACGAAEAAAALKVMGLPRMSSSPSAH